MPDLILHPIRRFDAPIRYTGRGKRPKPKAARRLLHPDPWQLLPPAITQVNKALTITG